VLPVRRSLKLTLDQETESEYESSPSPSPPPPPPYDMSQQQQQQQQQQQPRGEPSQAPTQQTHEEQLLAMIATLQQQVNTMLLQQQRS